jgi:EXLDI family protein
MPNKTIYVSDDDLALYQRAQELAGSNLSAAISTALRRYVEVEEGRAQGYDEVIVRTGPGLGRQQRFFGVLVGEWGRSADRRAEIFRVYRSRTGKFVVHIERSELTEGQDNRASVEKWNTGWRSWLGYWGSDHTWVTIPAESSLLIADSLEELRDQVPAELYTLIAETPSRSTIEDLDI